MRTLTLAGCLAVMPTAIAPAVVVAAVLGLSGCRGCDEPYQAHVRGMALREGACYALPVREATEQVRALLRDEEFPLPLPAADDPGFVATGWKDTTVRPSRLTTAGRPARARREVFLSAGSCLRVAVRAISQRTPKEGPDYADTSFSDSFEEEGLAVKIHARLQAHARSWQPPP